MTTYLVRRLLQSIVVLLAVTLFSFVLVYLSGDPVRALLPLDATQADVDALRHSYGLDQPAWVQYLTFMQHAARGDLGDSLKYRTSAMGLVLQRLPNTLLLATASILFATLVAVPLGVLAATHRGGWLDYLATGIAMLVISTPAFWLGIILILVFAGTLRWVPASGAGTPQQLILPAMTLAAYSIGLMTRLVRSTLGEALRQPYVTTARAKGLSEVRVNYQHALRNSLIPTVTVLGLQFGALLGGAAVIETVFAWPGLGGLLIQAINGRDLPLVRSSVLVIACFFVAINLLVDLLYGYLDPRIRYA
jgi:ABC-type dipeptide/oligopeptide/nickel transport system permease component